MEESLHTGECEEVSGVSMGDSRLFSVLFDADPTKVQTEAAPRALSRSGKKILHLDKNDYYGGSEAALSLDEAETWCKRISGRMS